MWNPGVGIVELAIVLCIAVALPLLIRGGSRWLAGILPCFVVAMLVTPADLLSMLLVAIPLSAAFVIGVYASDFVRRARAV